MRGEAHPLAARRSTELMVARPVRAGIEHSPARELHPATPSTRLWRLPTATIAKSAPRAASSHALHRRRLTRRTAQPHWGSELEMLSKKRVCSSPPLEALLCPHPLLKTSSDRHPMPRRRPCPFLAKRVSVSRAAVLWETAVAQDTRPRSEPVHSRAAGSLGTAGTVARLARKAWQGAQRQVTASVGWASPAATVECLHAFQWCGYRWQLQQGCGADVCSACEGSTGPYMALEGSGMRVNRSRQ